MSVSLTSFRSTVLKIALNLQRSLGSTCLTVQVGSCCGAAHFQAKTTVVSVRTSKGCYLSLACHVHEITPDHSAIIVDRRHGAEQIGYHECRCGQGALQTLYVAAYPVQHCADT